MRLSIAVLGCEVFAIELGNPPTVDDHPDLTSVQRHAGDFGFGTSPARPYWSSTYGDEPEVAHT